MNARSDHYLFALWEGAGLVSAELTVVRSLSERGHRVTVLADPPIREEALAAGAEFRAWATAPARTTRAPEDDLVADWETTSPFELMKRMRERFVVGPAPRFAADVAAAIEEVRPDAVVNDVLLLGAHVAGQAAPIPTVALVPNIYMFPAEGRPPFGTGWPAPRTGFDRWRSRAVGKLTTNLWDKGLPQLNTLREQYGLSPLDGLWGQLDQLDGVFVLTSESFDAPGQVPANVHYVGPQLDDPAWTATADWQPPVGAAPLVLVSLSSGYMNQGEVLQNIVSALGTLPVRAVVTTGLAIDPDSISAASSVQVVRALPHSVALDHAAVVVTHGGHGTLLKSLTAGVPVVCIPMGRDQSDNAARLIQTGAGVQISAKSSPARIAAAIHRVMDEPSFTDAAERMRSTLLGESDGSSRIVARLEELVEPGAARR